jgi:hypothetical protein
MKNLLLYCVTSGESAEVQLLEKATDDGEGDLEWQGNRGE